MTLDSDKPFQAADSSLFQIVQSSGKKRLKTKNLVKTSPPVTQPTGKGQEPKKKPRHAYRGNFILSGPGNKSSSFELG